MKNLLIIITILTLNFTYKSVHSDGHVEIIWETEKICEAISSLPSLDNII